MTDAVKRITTLRTWSSNSSLRYKITRYKLHIKSIQDTRDYDWTHGLLASGPCNLGSMSASAYLVFKALHLRLHNFQVELMIRFEMPWYIKWNCGRGFRKEVVGCWGVSVEPLEIVWEVNSANKDEVDFQMPIPEESSPIIWWNVLFTNHLLFVNSTAYLSWNKLEVRRWWGR